MLQKFEVSGVHTIINEQLHKYVNKKLGRIDKYLPRQSRQSAHMEVRLKEEKQAGKKLYTCDITLYLPHETIKMSETTLNMFAAVDIVHAKLKQQVERYKQSHTDAKRQRRLFARRKLAL